MLVFLDANCFITLCTDQHAAVYCLLLLLLLAQITTECAGEEGD